MASIRREPKTELQTFLTSTHRSALAKYRALVVGSPSLAALVRYELITTLAGPMPGALGYLLRKLLYPRLLRHCGSGVVFGRNIVLRHPHKIEIGDRSIIDDDCVLDAKGSGNRGIRIGRDVILARRTVLSCKNGDIEIGDNTNISMNCLIHSERSVRIGSRILIAAYCYLVGGGTHQFDRTDAPIIQQGSSAQGLILEDGVWLGARVTVLDGVRIGHDAIVGAGAVVTEDLPPYAIAVGTPARTIRLRQPQTQGSITAAGSDNAP